jgi:hypothetical protein
MQRVELAIAAPGGGGSGGGSSSGDVVPTETLSLNFEEIKTTYQQQETRPGNGGAVHIFYRCVIDGTRSSTLSARRSLLVISSGRPPDAAELVRHESPVGTGHVVSKSPLRAAAR